MVQEIILAAGCFWSVQAFFETIPGIIDTKVGYIGGTIQNPTYESVCQNNTNHAEAVYIVYDSKKISLKEILNLFFMIHDPTTLNRQGNDIGTQYRSAIFYQKTSDRKIIDAVIKKIAPYFPNPIVTEIHYGATFYPAEEYHQHYFSKTGNTSCINVEKNMNTFLKRKLMPEQYYILRERGTEPPFSGKYLYFDKNGDYCCVVCNQKIFHSTDKFNTSCGWIGFDKSIPNSIIIHKDFSHFMLRNEVLCSRCKSHLGHVFNDGPTVTGLRYCINSVSLNFKQKRSKKAIKSKELKLLPKPRQH